MAAPEQPQTSRHQPSAEVAQLRRSMVQQLTSSGKLLKAVFDIDRDYFGSRFHSKMADGPVTPFQDLEIATQVVETLSEELQGSAAFADSPVLRDNIANLVAGIDDLRKQVVDLEKTSLRAVGLPADKIVFNARVFPENNPLACMSEATGFIREVHTWLARTIERLKALGMMLQEAERARAEAEQTVPVVSAEEITLTLSAEIKARDQDLARLSVQAAQLQEQLADERRRHVVLVGGDDGDDGDDGELERLRDELAGASDQVRSDRAEVRSLVVEIIGLAANCEQEARADGKDQVDDLVINLSVLREAVSSDESTIESLSTAADAVLIEWSAWMRRREKLVNDELSTTRAFVAKHQVAQRLQADSESVKSELSTSKAAQARLEQELLQARARLAQHEGEVVKLRQEIAAAKTEAQHRHAEAEQAKLTAAKAEDELTKTRQELVGVQATSEKAIAEAKRRQTEVDLSGQSLRADGDKARAEAQRAQQEANRAQQEAQKTQEGAQQKQAELEQAKQVLAKVQDELAKVRQDADQGKQAAIDLATVRQQAAATASQLEAAARAKADAAKERDAMKGELDKLRGNAQSAAESAAKSAAQRDQELAGLRGKIAETQALQQSLTKERDEARGRLDELRKATASQSSEAQNKAQSLAQELAALRDAEGKAKAEIATAKGLSTRLEGELTQAKTRVAALEANIKQLSDGSSVTQAQKADAERRIGEVEARVKEAAARAADLQSQLDASKLVATAVTGERDKLRRDIERMQGEQSQLAKGIAEREGQLTIRLTETGRQLSELTQAHSRLESEHQRLKIEHDRVGTELKSFHAERRTGDSTSVWQKKISDGAVALDEVRSKSAALEKKLAEVRVHEVSMADRAGRLEIALKEQQERVRDLDRQLAESKRVAEEARKAAESGHKTSARLMAIETGSLQRDKEHAARLAELKDLLRTAREGVLQAKQWKTDMDKRFAEQASLDREIIQALMNQLKAAGMEPKV